MIILIITIALFLSWLIIHPYIINYDTVIAFTGGLGSGKSLLSTQYAIRLLRKNRLKVFWYNVRHPKRKIEKPVLYSSIPLRVSRKEWAYQLQPQHLLLTAKLPEKCVVFLDEIDSFASQFDYKEPNIIDNFDQWCRFFRHYTKGGYLVCNTQCTENIVLQVRRRINTVFNTIHFKKYLWLFYTVKIRNISISEEIKTIETDCVEDNYRTLFGILPVFCKRYDTYCYSERYSTVPKQTEIVYNKLKTNRFIKNPKDRLTAKVTDDEQ